VDELRESVVEKAALDYLREIANSTEFGGTSGPGGISQKRPSWTRSALPGDP